VTYLDSYRTAIASGDINQVLPFLDERIAWWGGEMDGRLRMGLRDTLMGLQDSVPYSRQPGQFFVLAYPLEEGLGYDIDWVHEAVVPEVACSESETCLRRQILHISIGTGGITGHSVRSLAADLQGDPGVDSTDLEQIEDRYAEIAMRLSSGDPEYAAEMMSDRAVWEDTGEGLQRINPRDQWSEQSAAAFAGAPGAQLTPMTTTDLGLPGPAVPAVFFTPAEAVPWVRERTIGGVGVYRWTPYPSTDLVVCVEWLEQPHGVIGLAFKLQPTNFGVLLPEESNPWISDPTLWPQVPDASQLHTGTISTDSGPILLYNSTDSQQELVEWALDRFASAGLPLPAPRSIAFPPSAECILFAGLAVDTGDGIDLQLCFSATETCTDGLCTPSLTAMSTLLHELGHVWTVQNADEATRTAFLDARGLEVWRAPNVSRDNLGTEHAAEILSWALLEIDNVPARLPNNDCLDLANAYRALTGRTPLRSCASEGA